MRKKMEILCKKKKTFFFLGKKCQKFFFDFFFLGICEYLINTNLNGEKELRLEKVRRLLPRKKNHFFFSLISPTENFNAFL